MRGTWKPLRFVRFRFFVAQSTEFMTRPMNALIERRVRALI
jgi:hypothetical protein